MTKTLKALGVLLTYPTEQLQAASAEIAGVIDTETKLPKREKAALRDLIEELAQGDTLELQEKYVELFDRARESSLNLFEHIHGESRERGQAMVDLMQVYTRAGFSLASNELPDYLPVILEFLSERSFADADEMLSDCAHIVRRIGEALRSRNSRYHAVPAALLAMIGEAGLAANVAKGASADTDARVDRNVARQSLDEDWMDAPVIFGPEGAPDCKSSTPAPSVIHFMPRRH